MGFILALAVLLDATLVRLLLEPVVLRLLGPCYLRRATSACRSRGPEVAGQLGIQAQ
jgi:uncharacterized membrane protein YdfJ with MMPL/SSD domain